MRTPRDPVRIVIPNLPIMEDQEWLEDERLSGTDNYFVWADKIKTKLQSEELWLDVIVARATGTTAAANLSTKKSKAIYYLKKSAKPSLRIHLVGIDNPAVARKKLKDIFETSSMARRIALRKKLTNLRFFEGKTIDENYREVINVVNQLAAIGTIVDSSELVELILGALPHNWEVLSSVVIGQDKAPSINELWAKLFA